MNTCSIEDCDGKAHARGWCPKHYYRWKRQGSAEYVKPGPAVCQIDDCEEPNYGRGWCLVHWSRWRERGDPLKLVKHRRSGTCELDDCDKPSPGQRYCPMHLERLKRNGNFERQVRIRHHNADGYAVVKSEGHVVANHRGWAYEHRRVLFDKIGSGEHDCHWCGLTVSWDRTYPQHADALVVDHLNEVKDDNRAENLVPSCAVCNLQRSSRWNKSRREESA